jgi:hypothetical protein
LLKQFSSSFKAAKRARVNGYSLSESDEFLTKADQPTTR